MLRLNSGEYSFLRIVLHLPKVKLFGRINISFKFRGLTAEIITTTVETVNFFRMLCLRRGIGPSKECGHSLVAGIVHRPPRFLCLPQPCHSQAPRRMPYFKDAPLHELPVLAGWHHTFQNDLSWHICSLTRLSFSLFPVLLPSSPLPSQASSGRIFYHARVQPSSASIAMCFSPGNSSRGTSSSYSRPYPMEPSLSHSLSLPLSPTLPHRACVTSHFPFVLH